MPALDWLQANACGLLGLSSPTVVYWASGTLSSLLETADLPEFPDRPFGTQGQPPGHRVDNFPDFADGRLIHSLAALSVAAVFFGGCSYIGNAPNLMVKAIVERRRLPLPGFLGYIFFKWTIPVMLPLLILVWLIFFR